MNRKLRIATVILGSLITAWAVFAGGFVAGNLASERGFRPLALLAGVPPAAPPEEVGDLDFDIFWEAWNAIQASFYKGPLDPDILREGAIHGLAQSTGDPYTIYQNAAEARRARDHLDGSFEGVGIQVQLRDGLPLVLQPMPGSPAERAGVRPNEFVLAVDGVPTEGMTLSEFGDRVRGPQGTVVVLTLRPEGGGQERDVTIVRDRILLPSVSSRVIDGIGYLRLYNFSSRTAEEVREALAEFDETGVGGLVLDLRNNPGGFLNASVDVVGQFLPEGTLILTQESRDELHQEYRAGGGAKDTTTPMVVLVNQGTASASEIVAGSLQAHDRALLLGEETFGKGSMQELHRLSDESLVRVTSGIWITPADINLSGQGLIPDVVLEAQEGQIGSDDDNVLQAALRYLRGEPAWAEAAAAP